MKKTLLIVAIILSMCLLTACNLGGGIPSPTTAASTTRPQTGGTTAPPSGDSTPTLEALSDAMQTASPARIRLSLGSYHAAMGDTLCTDAYILIGENESYYYYKTEYFLPLAEALSAKEVKGIRTGHVLTDNGVIMASSAEINAELLADLREYSIRKPTPRADLFEEYAITREGDLVILTATAGEGVSGILYDPRLEGAQALSLSISFAKDGLLPISYRLQMTAADGTPLSYEATYSYTPAPMPTGEAVLSPDLTIWE